MSQKVTELASQLAREKWRGSGLSDEVAERLGMRHLRPHETKNIAQHFAAADALFIPYFNMGGEQTSFFRVRYLGSAPGFGKLIKKPRKYDQPAATLNEVYFPPLLARSWKEIACDCRTPLHITEGELKAAAACVHGFAALGLGGVDVWRSGKRGLEFLPGLAEIDWTERETYIIYDSDAATNPNVVNAQNRLAQELVARGARARIVSLSNTATGSKTGLDDFLLAAGSEALSKLIDEAPQFPESAALWEMNKDVVYIRDPGIVVARTSGQRLSAKAFKEHAFANRHYKEVKQGQKTTTLVEKSTAARWLAWEQRFELERMTYAPGKPQITDAREWNTWKGWGVVPKKGSIVPWNWLLNYIFRADLLSRRWFEQWLAYPLQHPGSKLFSSAVLWSVYQGTGKTLLGRTMMRIYGDNSAEIQDTDLRGNYNGWALDRQFVLGEEVVGNDKRALADRFKSMITQEQVRINEKYIPVYSMPDCINYLFTSNHPDAFFLEDTDRRFFIHEIVGPPEERAKYEIYDDWYRSYGASALFDHLLQLDTSDFNPRDPAPMTGAKQEMIDDNKSDMASWVLQLREDPDSALVPLGERVAKAAELLTNTQLLQAYASSIGTAVGVMRVTANGLARELKRQSFRKFNGGLPIRANDRLAKLYIIRNPEHWQKATIADAAKHYAEVMGQEKY